MSKRSAAEAFSGRPLSAFAAAKARKQASFSQTALLASTTEEIAAADGATDNVIETTAPALEKHEAFGYTPEPQKHTTETGVVTVTPRHRLVSYSKGAIDVQDGVATVKLRPNDWITATGIYDLFVTDGALSIYGAYLSASDKKYRVYAPLTHALPPIRARFASVIELHSVVCSLPLLDSLSPLWNRVWRNWEGFSFAIPSMSPNEPLNYQASPLEIDDPTQKVLNRLSAREEAEPPRVLVSGPKAAGKSTFCRCLINAIVSERQADSERTCFLLDLDPGQPEFGPAGQVSLVQIRAPVLGPAFTHCSMRPGLPYRTIRAHTLAANSPREDMDFYLRCAVNLCKHYVDLSKQFDDAPLVINCPGWVTGSGTALVERLIKSITVTDAVVFEPSDFQQQDPISFPKSVKVKSLPSYGRSSNARPSAESRAMQTMSYFHAARPIDFNTTWSSRPLSTLPAMTLSYSGPKQVIAAILSYHVTIPSDLLATVLEGMPISLVIVETMSAFHGSPSSDDTATTNKALQVHRTPEDLPYKPPTSPGAGIIEPLNPEHSYCLGQALIHKTDHTKKEFQLVTPISEAEIQRALSKKKSGQSPNLVLVRGKLDSPDWAFLEDVHYQDSMHEQGMNGGVGGMSFGADFDLEEDEEVEDRDGDAMEGLEQSGQNVQPDGKRIPHPYVSVRPVRVALNGEGQDTRAGEILSERVWRPRHLPRNAR
ncbi:Polynucleotide 5'-hydroxyl-kinase grc3 [Elsinoe australis]|uniref:Polynucleotide 5'-hydroxyl-kinase GRC3 n=1 Tax=Elsinoe australis TaxID=40998 RepID=A0A2P7YRC1_9PEZI|nr:Polynucleotide 5'-hydroxyl-kinase grc3 [Elsinoe australis]